MWCPSDPAVSAAATLPASAVFFSWEAAVYPDPIKLQFSSYAACTGDWFVQSAPNGGNWQDINASNNGLIHLQSNRKMADITDGTSNTIALGERGHGLLDPSVRDTWHWWAGVSRVMFTAQWPMNPQKQLSNGSVSSVGPIIGANPSIFLLAASGFHANGCNFAFVDGSVHFLKESIDSWPLDPTTGDPTSLDVDANGIYFVKKGAKVGVYQALATRNGGEVVGEIIERPCSVFGHG